MPIDCCPHTFQHLASEVMPRYTAIIRQRIEATFPMVELTGRGIGRRGAQKRLGMTDDFSGCYVFVDGTTPIYCGISRRLIFRLTQHVKGRDQNSASLAYRLACEKMPHEKQRGHAMEEPKSRAEFDRQREYIQSLKVAHIEIECPVEPVHVRIVLLHDAQHEAQHVANPLRITAIDTPSIGAVHFGEPAARHTDRNLQTLLAGDPLQTRLIHLAREAGSALEEQGYNILYLALGMVEWQEPGGQGTVSRAPLVLISRRTEAEKRSRPIRR